MGKYMWAYIAVINIAAFCVCGIDKRAAIKKEWRIPEKTLFLLSIIGGSVGMLVGMSAFHHKTRKPAFYIGIPAIFIVQIGLALYLFL